MEKYIRVHEKKEQATEIFTELAEMYLLAQCHKNGVDLMEEHIQKIRKASDVTIENDISEQHRRMARQYFEAKEKQAEREKLKKEIIKELTPALAKELRKIFK